MTKQNKEPSSTGKFKMSTPFRIMNSKILDTDTHRQIVLKNHSRLIMMVSTLYLPLPPVPPYKAYLSQACLTDLRLTDTDSFWT